MKSRLLLIAGISAVVLLAGLSCSKQIEKACSSCPSPKPQRPVYIEASAWHVAADSSLYWTDFSDTLTKLSKGYNYVVEVYLILGGGEYNLREPYYASPGEIYCTGTYLGYTPNGRGPMPFKTLSLKVIIE
jgi:hypothetical protein